MASENIDETGFQKEVIKSKKASIVFFYTLWDAGSRTSSPSFERAALDYSARLAFYKYDAGAQRAAPTEVSLSYFPTVAIFRQGKEIGRIIGAFTNANLEKFIDITIA